MNLRQQQFSRLQMAIALLGLSLPFLALIIAGYLV